MREEGSSQPFKEWHSHWGSNKNWLKQSGPSWQKIQLPVHLEAHYTLFVIHLVYFISVPQSFLTLCDPMDCSTPGFPAHQTPGINSNSWPSSLWCHPTISSSVVIFSSSLQFFQASRSFLMSQFHASGGQLIGVSASASVFPMNSQDWSPLGLTGWISLHSKGFSGVLSNTTVQKHQFFGAQLSL